eukprot:scaffold166461_cov43-Prasinocladus_malaysianus.AAC.6
MESLHNWVHIRASGTQSSSQVTIGDGVAALFPPASALNASRAHDPPGKLLDAHVVLGQGRPQSGCGRLALLAERGAEGCRGTWDRGSRRSPRRHNSAKAPSMLAGEVKAHAGHYAPAKSQRDEGVVSVLASTVPRATLELLLQLPIPLKPVVPRKCIKNQKAAAESLTKGNHQHGSRIILQ